MLRRTNIKTGKLEQLSNKEIKAGIFKLLGLDPNNPADQLRYKREYNVFYLRVRNYNALQELEEPKLANETFLRMLEYQARNQELPNYIKQILQTPAQTFTTSKNVQGFSSRLSTNRAIKIQVDNEEAIFKRLLDTNPSLKRRYNEWKYGFSGENGWVLYADKTTGELIGSSIILSLDPSTYETIYDITLQEVRDFLTLLADDLHARQEQLKKSGRHKEEAYN